MRAARLIHPVPALAAAPARAQQRNHALVAAMLATASLLASHARASSELDLGHLSESEVTLLDQTQPGAPAKNFLAATIMAAPMGKICAEIQNYAQYPAFMPNVAQTSVKTDAEQHPVVDFTLHLPLGKIKQYRVKMTASANAQQCRLEWKQVPWAGLKQEQTIQDTTGYWLLTPLAQDSNKTVVKYHATTDPGPVPVGLGWIVDSMSKGSIPKLLTALRQRVAP